MSNEPGSALTHYHGRLAVHRLTALWALNESGLGGIMHALKIPFTGLLVGGIAIVLIALIAYFSDRKFSVVVRSLLVVLMVKLIISPHSPPTAYAAVTFQAIVGGWLFSLLSNFKAAAMILGVVGMLESALQKLLTLVIIFGKSIWEAIDLFFNFVLEQFGLSAAQNMSFSTWLILAFVGLYLIGGVAIGWLAGRLPQDIEEVFRNSATKEWLRPILQSRSATRAARKPSRWNRAILHVAIIAAVVLSFAAFSPGNNGAGKALTLLLRVMLILIAWYFVIAPFLMKMIRKYLRSKQGAYQSEINEVLSVLPELRKLIDPAWKAAKGRSWHRRIQTFLLYMIVLTLTYREEAAP